MVGVDVHLGSVLCVDMGTATNVSEVTSAGILRGRGRVSCLFGLIGSVGRKILTVTSFERALLITCSCSQSLSAQKEVPFLVSLLETEDGGRMYIRNVYNTSHDKTVQRSDNRINIKI